MVDMRVFISKLSEPGRRRYPNLFQTCSNHLERSRATNWAPSSVRVRVKDGKFETIYTAQRRKRQVRELERLFPKRFIAHDRFPVCMQAGEQTSPVKTQSCLREHAENTKTARITSDMDYTASTWKILLECIISETTGCSLSFLEL